MAEFNSNVWAPWRAEYIRSFEDQARETECFLCDYLTSPADDLTNYVVGRSAGALTVLNRYPYTAGHLLIAPLRHVAEPDDFADDELLALARAVRDAARMLKSALQPQGFNIGMNLGRCAGAGLPGHLHWHVVPRWIGDTNFMPIVGDARVISDSLDHVAQRLRTAAEGLAPHRPR